MVPGPKEVCERGIEEISGELETEQAWAAEKLQIFEPPTLP